MANIKMSKDYIRNGYLPIENIFISDFMPSLSNDAIKTYLYSLYVCANHTQLSSLDAVRDALDIDLDQLTRAVEELKTYDLVRILNLSPLEYEIIPITNSYTSVKKYKPEKYTDFTMQLQGLFPDRTLMPSDYLKYFEIIEDYKIAPEALIMIVGYCVRIKTSKIHHNYIIAVAKDWAKDGVTSIDAVENKLKEMESNSENMRQIFYILNLKSTPDVEDKQLYVKWTKSWGYTFEAIIATAKLCKKRGGMSKLDKMLDQFYRLNIFTLQAIQQHAEYIDNMRKLAYDIIKKIGVYYDNVDNIIETYIAKWQDKGFKDDALLTLADYCFKNDKKTLSSMDSVVEKFYQLGALTIKAINQHIDMAIDKDRKIKHLLELAGNYKSVRDNDRACYNTWISVWNFNDEIIQYCATLANGKSQPFAYMNQILSAWREKGYTALQDCKANQPQPTANSSARFEGERNYTKEELDSIIGDLSDISLLDDLKF